MIAVVYAPDPEFAFWVKYLDDVKVCSNARSLDLDGCKAVFDCFERSRQFPQLQENPRFYRNTRLSLQQENCGVWIYNEAGERSPVPLVHESIQDVTSLIGLARDNKASRLCVLTTGHSPRAIAELRGQCKGCGLEGFLNITPSKQSDCLLNLQCHGCGNKLLPTAVAVAGYAWHMRGQVGESASGTCRPIDVDMHEASPDPNKPEIYDFQRKPGDRICELIIAVQAGCQGRPHANPQHPQQVAAGVLAMAGGSIVQGFPPQIPQRASPGGAGHVGVVPGLSPQVAHFPLASISSWA